MKEAEIEKLLRKEHALEAPRPNLDRRIQANLPEGRSISLLWLTAAAAAFVVFVGMGWLVSTRPASYESEVGAIEDYSSPEIPQVSPAFLFENNPLEEEAVALQVTARKTTNFLLSRFPSLPDEKS